RLLRTIRMRLPKARISRPRNRRFTALMKLRPTRPVEKLSRMKTRMPPRWPKAVSSRPPASRHKSGALATVILRGVPLRMTNWAQLRSRELFKEFVLAEKKSGIRINALAKELGIESKAILEKLRAEGLGDSAPNHMSTISLGLAESVREWFAAG